MSLGGEAKRKLEQGTSLFQVLVCTLILEQLIREGGTTSLRGQILSLP